MPDPFPARVDPVAALRPRLYVHRAGGTETQPPRYVLAEEADQSAISSRWIACERPAEVRR